MAASYNFRLNSTQSALALIIPEHLQPDINSLRRIHDKAYGKWPPHINIVYPFVDPLRLSAAVSILKDCLRQNQLGNVAIDIDGVGVFRHRKNATIFLKPSPESQELLYSLRAMLVTALGCKESDGTYDGRFRAHLSVGQAGFQGDSIGKLVEKAEKLAGFQWKGISIAVLKRDRSGEMRVVEELPFDEIKDEGKGPFEPPPIDFGWRACYYSDPENGWINLPQIAAGPAPSDECPAKATISSYNVMAESFAPPFKMRLPLIIDAISSSTTSPAPSVNILCFQEVNDESLPLLLADPYINKTYPFSTHSPSSLLPSQRNVITLASRPFKYFTIDFAERHKSAIIIKIDGLAMNVINVHLTSALSDQSVMAKRTQMETLTKFLAQSPQSKAEVIIAGDFNLTTSSQTVKVALDEGYITAETALSIKSVIDHDVWDDAFVVCKNDLIHGAENIPEGEDGATFDRFSNPLASISPPSIGNRPQRYDRVLFQKGGQVQPENFEIFGLPNHDGQCGSDHYGICVTFQVNETTGAVIQSNLNSLVPDVSEMRPKKLQVIEDFTDLEEMIESYLPGSADCKQREEALKLLQKTLSAGRGFKDLVLAPLGSYLMGTYFADSDVDLLAIGSVSPQVFFDITISELQGLDKNGKNKDDGFKSIHFVNSLVPIVELVVLGIKVDLQYCQAPELLQRYVGKLPPKTVNFILPNSFQCRYHAESSSPDLATLVFDQELVSKLAPSSLRPLNTYRDTAYLLNTIPDIKSYRTAHRFLSLYLKLHGLYSAKFGYLGGIHLSLMLNRVVKLLPQNQSVTPGSIVRTFFVYYASFDWATDIVSDPALNSSFKTTVRTAREAVFIHAIHSPTARPNVASSCTRLSAQTIMDEFSLAALKLAEGSWKWCHQPQSASVSEFLNRFSAFVRIKVDIWNLDQTGGAKMREMLGGLESSFVRLMVGLGRLNSIQGRVWPNRLYRIAEQQAQGEVNGYYLVGVTANEESADMDKRKLTASKVVTAVLEFERSVKGSRDFESGNMWVAMDVVPKKKILEMGLVADQRDWSSMANYTSISLDDDQGLYQEDRLTEGEKTHPHRTSEFNLDPGPPAKKSRSPFLRPAQDIIARIRWDPELVAAEFVIGYEDRFLGVKEIELERWKGEQTDEEFIPMHRIVWVKKKDQDGDQMVWDRKRKVDAIFNSGFGPHKQSRGKYFRA
jgi:poly(A) polymerase Pap1/uncharacterized protein (UPF0248 family)/2'-5' RNA ligase/endonuclease/exonuclease/phosphatase family metal-dependent hydrolase